MTCVDDTQQHPFSWIRIRCECHKAFRETLPSVCIVISALFYPGNWSVQGVSSLSARFFLEELAASVARNGLCHVATSQEGTAAETWEGSGTGEMSLGY